MSPGGRWIKADMEVWWSFPTLITFFLCRTPVWPLRQRDRQRFLDVGFLVGRVLTLVFCLLVWAIFLSLHQYQRLDHHPQTLKGRGTEMSSNATDVTHSFTWKCTDGVKITIRHCHVSLPNSCKICYQIHRLQQNVPATQLWAWWMYNLRLRV